MKIVLASITYEGIMRGRKELMNKLKDEDNEIYIVAPTSRSTEDAKQLGLNYIPITIEAHGKNPLRDYSLYLEYLNIYKSISPDVVLNFTIKPNVYSGLACRKLRIPYIGTINGIGDAIYNGGFLSWITLHLLKIGLKKASCIAFQNDKNRSMFVSRKIVPEEKTFLVPGSGINIALHPYEEYPHETNFIVLTFIGRVSRDKGVNELIQAARILKSKGERVLINIVGSCIDSYLDMIEKAHEEGIINYIGKVEPQAIHGIIKESHAVLLPSYHEGIANVLLEGGSAGRPLITTFAEGCEETFDDGISGIGFEPKSTEALVEAIEKFLSMTNEEQRTMGLEAHKKITTEFNRDLVDSAYIDKINKVKGEERSVEPL